MTEADRLSQILVEGQRSGDRAGDPAGLEGMGEAGPVVVALGGNEDLGLVLEATEGLRVDDPITIALERRPQRAVRLLEAPFGRIGAVRLRREELLLPGGDSVLKLDSQGHSTIIGWPWRQKPSGPRRQGAWCALHTGDRGRPAPDSGLRPPTGAARARDARAFLRPRARPGAAPAAPPPGPPPTASRT